MIFNFECPFCNHRNRLEKSLEDFTESLRRDDVVYCDAEEGGCDQALVFTSWLQPRQLVRVVVSKEMLQGLNEVKDAT